MTTRKITGQTTYTVPEAARLLGVSRNSAYQAVKRNGALAGVTVLVVGKRLVVPSAPLRAALGLPAERTHSDDQTDPI